MEKMNFNIRYVFLLLIFLSANLIAQTWDPSPWSYRRDITITNNESSPLTNYQVKIELTSDLSYAKADGSDIRVTDNDETTLIPYWIEEWNPSGNHAVIWAKVPAIPDTGTTIYLYYGNAAATSQSNGITTFNLFDDFSFTRSTWGNESPTHNWKQSSELMHGALEYAFYSHAWHFNTDTINVELEKEFNYIHSQIYQDGDFVGQVISDPGGSLAAEPEYCYGLILSNLAAGNWYYKSIGNSSMADQCYNDMLLVYDYLAVHDSSISPSYTVGYSWLLKGFSYAWRSLSDVNDTRVPDALTIIQNYSTSIINSQDGDGSWNGINSIRDELQKDIGLLYAHIINPSDTTYLFPVRENIQYILNTYWNAENGGLLEDGGYSDFNQLLFMAVARRLEGQSGGKYSFTSEGEQAYKFLTDDNPAGIDMFVHNYENNGTFFSYSDVKTDGSFQNVNYKRAEEIGVALWSFTLNYQKYANIPDYQSSHSNQAYDYLNMLVKQIIKTPANGGFSYDGVGDYNWISQLDFNPLWSETGTPAVSIIQDNGNYVASISGNGSSNDYLLRSQSFDNFVLEMNIKMTADANNDCTPEVGFRVTDNDNRYLTRLRGDGQNDMFIEKFQGGALTDPGSFPAFNYTADQYYKYKIVANQDTIRQYLDDVLVGSWIDASTTITNGGISLNNSGTNNAQAVYFDDVRVRSFAAVEPGITVGAHNNNPLPVELSSFSAVINGSSVKLLWKTETEVNNYGFEIERKADDGKSSTNNYKTIGFVNGNGNSNVPLNYVFIDKNLKSGKYIYRLKQIDNGGQFEYSKSVNVDFNSPKEFALSQNYPNPFNPSTTISFSLAVDSKVSLKIFNVLGQEVATLINGQLTAGDQKVNFDASSLGSGVYFYRIDADGIDGQKFSSVKKMILTK